MTFAWECNLDEGGVVRLAELLALNLRPGSFIALRGELGTGKSTLARALVRALLNDDAEVPSPTFSLQQVYATRRLQLTHFDFYRINSVAEALELGFEEAIAEGAVIAEWPERIAALLPTDRYEITLADSNDAAVRRVTLRGLGRLSEDARRLAAAMALLAGHPLARQARIRYL